MAAYEFEHSLGGYSKARYNILNDQSSLKSSSDGADDTLDQTQISSAIYKIREFRRSLGKLPLIYVEWKEFELERKVVVDSIEGFKRTLEHFSIDPNQVENIVEMKGKFEFNDGKGVRSMDFNPVSVLGQLTLEGMTCDDLEFLSNEGYLASVYAYIDPPSNISYFSYYTTLGYENMRRQSLNFLKSYNNYSKFNPLRLMVWRDYEILRDRLSEPPIHQYFTFKPVNESGVTRLGLNQMCRLLGLANQGCCGTLTSTYHNGTLNRNNDWFTILPEGSSIVVDGTGHGDAMWTKQEPPLYVKHLESRLVSLLSNPPDDAQETFDIFFDQIYLPFSDIYNQELDDRRSKKEEMKKGFNADFDAFFESNLDANEVIERFFDFLVSNLDTHYLHDELISSGKSDSPINKVLREFADTLHLTENVKNFRRYQIHATRELLKSLTGVKNLINSSKFTQIRDTFSHTLKFDFPRATSGSAFTLNMVLYTSKYHRLVTFAIADVCTIYFQYNPKTKKLEFEDILTQRGGALGGNFDQISSKSVPALVEHDFPYGGAYITFTDGIGEFLSVDTISRIVLEHIHEQNPMAVNNMRDDFFKEIIHKTDFKAGKYQATRLERTEISVKEYDTTSLKGIDDLAFVVGHIRPQFY